MKTVLIVDDDVDFLAIGAAVLEAAGYRVVSAEDVTSGLRLADSEHPDVILLDLMMEETDSGVQLEHQLRRRPATRKIPIALLTSVRDVTGLDFTPATHDDYAWIGAEAWVEKPIASGDLVALVSHLLGSAPRRERG